MILNSLTNYKLFHIHFLKISIISNYELKLTSITFKLLVFQGNDYEKRKKKREICFNPLLYILIWKLNTTLQTYIILIHLFLSNHTCEVSSTSKYKEKQKQRTWDLKEKVKYT